MRRRTMRIIGTLWVIDRHAVRTASVYRIRGRREGLSRRFRQL